MAAGQPNRGVVLIMVLSVLSILALLGITLVTVTRIDRQAARNYHEQVQAELLAQGGLSYVSGKLVDDIWRTGLLLEGEAYDAAGVDEDNDGQTGDLWLTNFPGTPDPTAVTQVSFAGPSATVFGYTTGGTTAVEGTDNLGTGTTDAPHNWGVWVQDLAVPLEGGRIGLVSLTVVDHSAMVNMNFHGDDESGTVGEVDIYNSPVFAPAGDQNALLAGNYNRVARPFSMADEVELRHLKGNRATTQLELAWPGTFLADGSGAVMVNRYRATTYSRTSMAQDFGGVIHGRIDINTADPDAIRAALEAADVTGDIDQIVVNIRDFRDADNDPGPEYNGKYGIERQCFISDAMCDVIVLRDFDEDPPDNIERVIFRLTIKLYNPYAGEGLDNLGGGLTTGDWRISFGDQAAIVNNMAGGDQQVFQMLVTIDDPDDENLLPSITLTRPVDSGEIIIDAITGDALEALLKLPDGDGLSARNYVARQIRAWMAWPGTSKQQTIVRIGAFEAVAASPDPGDIGNEDPATVRPIMIPNCVRDDDRLREAAGEELPLEPVVADSSYRAFARLGDLNQVLTVASVADGIPWTVRVAEEAAERSVKFDWLEYADASLYLSAYDPSNDGIDNDGDGTVDDGRPADRYNGAGEILAVGAPEWVVDGRINLNTAPLETLAALFWGAAGSPLANVAVAIADSLPLASPAMILIDKDDDDTLDADMETEGGLIGDENGDGVAGELEQEDAVWTRISNIAGVRSDTFGVYGTVRVVGTRPDPDNATQTIIEEISSRRFWALIDRSGSLAYPPGDENFISPRIVAFTWLD